MKTDALMDNAAPSARKHNGMLLKVHKLTKIFQASAGAFTTRKLDLKAVDNVSFDLQSGETLGLVGESGCGKTTVGRCLLRLYEPEGGRVFLDPEEERVQEILRMDGRIEEIESLLSSAEEASGEDKQKLRRELRELRHKVTHLARHRDILSMPKAQLKQIRRRLQVVFQDPWASLNPRMLVKDIVSEGPREFKTHSGRELDEFVSELLNKVGLPPQAASRYPHEFSGGQRQRIGVARALSVTPSLIVCDEPVSALDVSIQAQILNLLISLQDDFNLTYIFIAHDLSVVQYVSDRVAVMYLGRIVEISDTDQVINHARHPYTISLLSAVPVADPDVTKEEIILEGDVPSPISPPSGCTFHPRCPRCIDICREVIPQLEEESSGHFFACHNPP
jgi:peptide/nickel transport system ATP-binding protein